MFIWQSSLRIDSESDSVFEPGCHYKENIKDTKAFLIVLCICNQSHANCEDHGLDNAHFSFPYLFPLWSKTWTSGPCSHLLLDVLSSTGIFMRACCVLVYMWVWVCTCMHRWAYVNCRELLGAVALPVATRIYSRWQGIFQMFNHQMNNCHMEKATSSKAYGPQALQTGCFCL